jgi:hypothetical protein
MALTVSISTTFASFLAQRYQLLLVANDAEIIAMAETRDKSLISKIESFRSKKLTGSEATMLTPDIILERIRTDPLVRAHFRKDPGKQSVHESAQIEWIRTHGYPDIYKPPAGKGGFYLANGELTSAAVRPPAATKTLDMHSPSNAMWGVAKNTEEEGGAQDNQYRDVKQFIVEIVAFFNKTIDAPDDRAKKFMFFLDGAYYTPRRRDELRSMIPDIYIDKIIITSAADLT